MLLEIPIKTPSLTNQRLHWAKKHRQVKAQRKAAYFVWRTANDGPKDALRALLHDGGRLTVTLTRRAPRELDDDNLRAALKGVRDQIAEHMGVDDRDPRVTWEYGQVKGSAAVLVTIAESTR